MLQTLCRKPDLEAMVREAVKSAPGCDHVTGVQLSYTGKKKPNWRLRNTIPSVSPAALIEAHIAVERLADAYQMVDD